MLFYKPDKRIVTGFHRIRISAFQPFTNIDIYTAV